MENKSEQRSGSDVALHSAIDSLLETALAAGHFQALYLYSMDGLPIARAGDLDIRLGNGLLEVALIILEIKNAGARPGGPEDLYEVVVEGTNKVRFIYRMVNFLDRPALLAVIIPTRRAYRGVVNRLQKAIAGLDAD